MSNNYTEATFIWGPADKVRLRERMDLPSFCLCGTGGGLPSLMQSFVAQGVRPIRTINRNGRATASVYEDDDAVYLLAAGILPPDTSLPRERQASDIFPEMEGLLAEADMTFQNVVRTWLYIDRVCEWYGGFNAARSAFFESRNVFDTFLPASTGIGSSNTDGAAITSGMFAMFPKTPNACAEIVESPLQEPAMAYRSSFSRAAEISTSATKQLFISGTASIKPGSHDVAYVGDIVRQIDCTMTAVHAILDSRKFGWGDVSRAIVYLKDPSYRTAWQDWLAKNGLPTDFAAETVCDVCRDEWLFEIEADAVKGVRRI